MFTLYQTDFIPEHSEEDFVWCTVLDVWLHYAWSMPGVACVIFLSINSVESVNQVQYKVFLVIFVSRGWHKNCNLHLPSFVVGQKIIIIIIIEDLRA